MKGAFVSAIRLLMLLPLALFPAHATQYTPQTETMTVKSTHLDSPQQFNVTLPPSYAEKTDKRYVVLFDFHPRSQPLWAGMHDWLSHNGEWPWLETIIVTPQKGREDLGRMVTNLAQPETGLAFLDYLEKDVMAEVDKQYRTNGFRIMHGFMGNGAFALFTLLNRPEVFNAYIATSPSLADNFANILSDAPQKLKTLSGKPRFLYLSTGNHRFEQASLEGFAALQKALSEHAPEQLDWHARRFDEHFYMSRPVVSLLNGIEVLFDDYHNALPATSDISQKGPEAILAHYQYLSEQKYGFPVSAFNSIDALADAKEATEPDRAFAIKTFNAEQHPNMAYAWYRLAKAHAKRGDVQKAVDIQTRALALAEQKSAWHKKRYTQYLDEFKQQLEQAAGE